MKETADMLMRERERKRDNDSDRKTERESLRLAGGDQIIQTHLVEFFNDFSSFNKSLFQSRSILFLIQNLKFEKQKCNRRQSTQESQLCNLLPMLVSYLCKTLKSNQNFIVNK
jgi:hypothetical protein